MLAITGPGGFRELALQADIDTTFLRRALDTCCTDRFGSTERSAQPALTARTARLLAVAAQTAALDGDSIITATHLERALLEEPDSVAWRGLLAAGVTPVAVLDWLLVLRPGEPHPIALRSTRSRLVHALEAFLAGWDAASKHGLAASSDIERAQAIRGIAGARWGVGSLAEFGLRLGHLTYGQMVVLSGEDPGAARVALSELRRPIDHM